VQKYQTFIGFRYLCTRLFTILSLLAVMLSVAVLMVVLCVMWGFDRDFRTRIRGALSTIIIEGQFGEEIDDWEEVVDEIKDIEGVTHSAPYVESVCLLKTPSSTAYAVLRGVILERERKVGLVEQYFKAGNKQRIDFNLETPDGQALQPPYPGAVVGEELARQIGLQPKMRIRLVASRSPITRYRPDQFTVIGHFNSGWYEFDLHNIYIPLEDAQAMLGIGDAVTGVSVEVDDPARARAIRDEMRKKLGSICRVDTWEDRRRNFLDAIALERRVLAVIIGIVAFLAGFTILATIWMTVKEKTKDIGIIKSCGGTTLGIMSIFVLNGLYIGIVGAAIGLGSGLLFLANVNPISDFVERLTKFSVFPKTMYYIDKIPVEYNVSGITWIVLLAVILSVAYSIVPAWFASRLDPVEALRYE